MQQHIAAADHRKDAFKLLGFDRAVFELAFLGARQGWAGAALVRFFLELGQGDGQKAHQVVEAEGAIDSVHVLGFHRGAVHQQLHHRFWHLIGHLQAHHFTAAAAFAQALLQGLHQVVGLEVAQF